MSAHVHVIPVPLGMTPEDAWAEITTLGKLAFPPDSAQECSWANIECDGEECASVELSLEALLRKARSILIALALVDEERRGLPKAEQLAEADELLDGFAHVAADAHAWLDLCPAIP